MSFPGERLVPFFNPLLKENRSRPRAILPAMSLLSDYKTKFAIARDRGRPGLVRAFAGLLLVFA